MTLTEFEMLAADRGHGNLREVDFEAGRRPDLHPHAWSTLLLLTRGTLDLVFEDRTVHLEPGDWCEVEPGELHSEQAGAEGASAMLATRAVD